ncbi:MAG: peptidoglycan DD-metalloendopeptidase family protein [Erysipelotrichaceae bacterium]
MNDEYNEIDQQTNESLDKGKQAIQSGGKKMIHNLQGKSVLGRKVNLSKRTKKLRNKIKVGTMRTLKNIGKAFLKLIIPFIPYLAIMLACVLLLGLFASFWHNLFYDDTSRNGNYLSTSETSHKKIKNDSSVTSFENTAAILFYTKFSTQSYFYTLDDDAEIHQASADDKVKDFEDREKMFALSPSLLVTLDRYLNNGAIMPEQFLKPIYNSCSTGETTNGICLLKNLDDSKGNLKVKSTGYEKKLNKTKSGEKYITYQKTDKKEVGVWDWGLAPILHYKTFQQEHEVQNYQVDTIQIYNRKSRKVETVKYDKLTEQQKKDFPEVVDFAASMPTSVVKGSSEDNGIPADVETHAIDSVASMLGQITNSLSRQWVFQNVYKNMNNPVHWDKWYEGNDVVKEDLKDESMEKKIEIGGKTYIGRRVVYIKKHKEATKEEKKYCKEINTTYNKKNKPKLDKEGYKKCIASYENVEGYDIDGVIVKGEKKSFKISVHVKQDLTVTRIGKLMLNTVVYDDGEPNLSESAGLRYLKSYISNYETYIPYKEKDTQNYICKDLKDGNPLKGKIEATDLTDSTSLGTFMSQVHIENLLDTTPSGKIKHQPNKCEDGQVAAVENETTMKKFNVGKLPTLQYLAIAKALGFDASITGDKLTSIERPETPSITDIGIGASSNKSEIIRNNKELYSAVKEYSDTYGLDINLVMAVTMAASGGEVDFQKAGDSCNNDTGCGIMGIRTNNFEGLDLKAYNYKLQKEEVFSERIGKNSNNISKNDLMNPNNNIRYGCMLLQRYFEKYQYNYIMALQAYNYGGYAMDNFLNYYQNKSGSTQEFALEDTILYEWTGYRAYCSANPKECFNIKKETYGDKDFPEKVLQNFGTLNEFSVRKKNGEYASSNFEYLKENNENYAGSQTKALNNKAMNFYLKKGNAWFETYWDILYLGQKPFSAGTINLNKQKQVEMPDTATKIEYPYRKSRDDVDNVIKSIFAFDENSETREFDDLSDEYWKTKYAAMFKTVGSKSWSSTYDLSKIFNGAVDYPIKNPIVIRDFGYTPNELGKKSYSSKTDILGAENEKVKAIASGTVQYVKKEAQGVNKTIVTILHNAGDGKIAGEAEKDKTSQDLVGTVIGDKNDSKKTGTLSDVSDMTQEQVTELIEKRFSLKLNSKLSGQGKKYVAYCYEKNVNPFLAASIAMLESANGTSELAQNANNFGGMKATSSTGKYNKVWAKFPSVKAGWTAQIDLIAMYVHDWKLFLPSKMAAKYCEGSKSWIVKVNEIYIEISHKEYEDIKALRLDVLGENSNKKFVSYSYYNLTNIKVKEGDTVSVGDNIGAIGKDNKFSMSLIDDDHLSSVGAVIEALSDMKAKERNWASLTGEGLSGTQISGSISFEDIKSKKGKLRAPVSGNISAGTWYYAGSSVSHEALDVANSIGTPIYAIADSAVFMFKEDESNCANGQMCGGAGNYVAYVFQMNDKTYMQYIWHINPGSVSKYIKERGDKWTVKEGEVIAEIGHNGQSTGPHAHIGLVYWGDTNPEEVVRYYQKTKTPIESGYSASSINQNPKNKCEVKRKIHCIENAQTVAGN